jgi:hypothetical protein
VIELAVFDEGFDLGNLFVDDLLKVAVADRRCGIGGPFRLNYEVAWRWLRGAWPFVSLSGELSVSSTIRAGRKLNCSKAEQLRTYAVREFLKLGIIQVFIAVWSDQHATIGCNFLLIHLNEIWDFSQLPYQIESISELELAIDG